MSTLWFLIGMMGMAQGIFALALCQAAGRAERALERAAFARRER